MSSVIKKVIDSADSVEMSITGGCHSENQR